MQQHFKIKHDKFHVYAFVYMSNQHKNLFGISVNY